MAEAARRSRKYCKQSGPEKIFLSIICPGAPPITFPRLLRPHLNFSCQEARNVWVCRDVTVHFDLSEIAIYPGGRRALDMIVSQDYMSPVGVFRNLLGSYYQLLSRSWRNIVNTKIKKFPEFLSIDSL